MGCHKTDSLKSLNLIDFTQQFRKRDRILQVLSVRIDILTKQHNFTHTISNQSLDLTDDILRLTASLATSYIRYNTVAAEIITAEHNVNARLKGEFTLNRKIFYNLVRIFPDINDHRIRLHAAA